MLALETPHTIAPVAADFRAIGTSNQILATRPDVLGAAVAIAKDYLDALDWACSRFRPDSEVSRLAAASATEPASLVGSPMLVDHLEASRYASRLSDGLVDPTVGSALISSGYDADLAEVQARDEFHQSVPGVVAGWQRVELTGSRITTPAGVLLDFGATAKAHAADMIARLLALQLPGSFLVNLGGDLATAGEGPDGGWRVAVEAADGSIRQVISIAHQAVATSSTQLRTWATSSGNAHHIIDPRTGRPAAPIWGQVTCVAITALEANTAATAAVVLGEDAVAWLTGHGLAARLERPDGSVVCTAGWPQPASEVH
ncbi:thiamine biosynthesis lipoprotein [Propionicimonas paludicola]|uniref:FAD:protein FMN transferase n=1 Tax=Propionicimonas paludicola TaxID=185243 RepID=A0A2A9CPJ6_9ACTN|nr:FAD:protein FMN transferase [Propionicimonas paludicola]PFG15532.1 thiamine biosynthesis lipoprotein [Propionicimonas paludicola]